MSEPCAVALAWNPLDDDTPRSWAKRLRDLADEIERHGDPDKPCTLRAFEREDGSCEIRARLNR